MAKEEEIVFTPELAKKFRVEYDKAKAHGKDTFVFEGKGFFTDYAKYLLEHLEKFGPKYICNSLGSLTNLASPFTIQGFIRRRCSIITF